MKKINIVSAVLAAIASAAGIFLDIYSESPWTVAQLKGQDAVTAAAAVVLILTAVRRDLKSSVISAGLNAYLIYTYFFYALETRLNPLFHVYLAIVLLSLIAFVKTTAKLIRIKETSLNFGAKSFSMIYLCIIASVLTFLWNTDIIATLAGTPILENPTGEPLTIVYVFDLTFVIPAIIYTIYLLKKDRPFGLMLCGIMLTKCVTMGAALLGMTIGVWAGNFELERFLAVFWLLLTSGGIAALGLFMRGIRISE